MIRFYKHKRSLTLLMVVDTVATCPELLGVFTLLQYPVEFTLDRTDGGW